MMYRDEETWFALMNHLVDYVVAQVEAGAEIIQIFDSWVGALNVKDYRYYIKPAMNKLISGIKAYYDVPIILFGVGASHLINEWNDLPIDVLGLDWRTTIKQADKMGVNKAIQGNLDPSVLLAPWDVIESRLKDILNQGLNRGKHIFNLGHGVFPEVKPETLRKVTEFVHNYTAK